MGLKISPQQWLKDDPLLLKLLLFHQSHPEEVYLVGGYLRDKLLGRRSKDVDLLIKGDVSLWAKDLAQYLRGSFFFLDKVRGIARVVLPKEARTLDFVPFKNEVERNLKARDFTVDAMALGLKFLKERAINLPEDLLDISSGFFDLFKGKVKALSVSTFRKDPLRILRAVRLATELDFEIEENTRNLILRDRSLLGNVASERVQGELFLILSLPRTSEGARLASSLGLIEVVLPELASLKGVTQDRYHHLDVWGHTLLTLEELERVTSNLKSFFPGFERDIRNHLKRHVQGRPRLSLLKLGALFHDLGKPQTKAVEKGRIRFLDHPEAGVKIATDILSRLKMGKKTTQAVCHLIREHLRPGFLSEQGATPRAIHRLFRDCGEEVPEVILLSLADRLASRGPASTQEQLKRHLFLLQTLVKALLGQKIPKPSPILTGKDLIKKFDLQPGPLIGRLLKVVEEAQFEGKVSRKEEAFLLVEKILARDRT